MAGDVFVGIGQETSMMSNNTPTPSVVYYYLIFDWTKNM